MIMQMLRGGGTRAVSQPSICLLPCAEVSQRALLIARCQLMHSRVEPRADNVTAAPRSLDWGGRRIDVVEMIDQWYGADYRYVKVKGSDGAIYMLRFNEIHDEWVLIMFV